MEKIKSFRKGRIWLNVFKANDGKLALTIRKSFPAQDGGWKHTSFLRPHYNDLEDLVQVLTDFVENKDSLQAEQGWSN